MSITDVFLERFDAAVVRARFGDGTISRALSVLSERYPGKYEAMRLRADGLTYREIGSHFGLSHEQGRQRVMDGARRVMRFCWAIKRGEM